MQADRQAHDPAYVKRIIEAQPALRHRIAIMLMARLGLRKDELRNVRIQDFDLTRSTLRVLGKGRRIAHLPLTYEDLRLDLERLMLEENPEPREYLLYPVRVGNLGGRSQTVAEYKTKPMVASGLHRWWAGCLRRARVPHFPMHELRHTAGHEFYLSTSDIVLTQMFMRHASPSTTIDHYLHLDQTHLIEGMRLAEERWEAQTEANGD